jgi:hypothetical protein
VKKVREEPVRSAGVPGEFVVRSKRELGLPAAPGQGRCPLSRPYETDAKRSRFSLQALLEPFAFLFSIPFCFEWLRDRDVLDAPSLVDYPMSAGLHEGYITRGWVARRTFHVVGVSSLLNSPAAPAPELIRNCGTGTAAPSRCAIRRTSSGALRWRCRCWLRRRTGIEWSTRSWSSIRIFRSLM